MNRYNVIEGSQCGHCCIKATVVDTSKPVFHCDDVEKVFPMYFEVLCECLTIENANRIAASMNKGDSRPVRKVSKNSMALSCFSPATTEGIKQYLIDNGYEIDD